MNLFNFRMTSRPEVDANFAFLTSGPTLTTLKDERYICFFKLCLLNQAWRSPQIDRTRSFLDFDIAYVKCIAFQINKVKLVVSSFFALCSVSVICLSLNGCFQKLSQKVFNFIQNVPLWFAFAKPFDNLFFFRFCLVDIFTRTTSISE